MVTHRLWQWAAVSSHRSLMRDAPQKRWVWKKRPACQGCELGWHSSAPMALVSAQLFPGGRWEAEGSMKSMVGGLGRDAEMPRGQAQKSGGAKGNVEGWPGRWKGSRWMAGASPAKRERTTQMDPSFMTSGCLGPGACLWHLCFFMVSHAISFLPPGATL